MKRTLTLLAGMVIAHSAMHAQEVVFEQEYTRNLTTPSDIITLPMRDGGMFMAYCKSPKVSPKPSQVLLAFDKDKKKTMEFATGDVVEFKNKQLNFLYNETNNKFFGVYPYQKKGAGLADVMLLSSSGSYTVKAAIPTPLHVVHAFVMNGELVLLGLGTENKRSGEMTKVPSGEFEAVIIKGDLTSYTSKKLTMPSFLAEKGISKNKLVEVDGQFLYFVTETRSEAFTGKLSVSYDFTKYDFTNNKVESTKNITVDMENNSPRTSHMVVSDRPELTVFDEYADDFPNVFYDKTEKAFFVVGSYGAGYPADASARKHEGGYVLRISKDFALEWKSMIQAPAEVLQGAAFSAANSDHYVGLVRMKGKTYFTTTAKSGDAVNGSVYEMDMKTGKATLVKATDGEPAEKVLLNSMYAAEAKNVAALAEKDGMAPYLLNTAAGNYLVINNTTKNKVFIYRFN